jgi:ferredoxin
MYKIKVEVKGEIVDEFESSGVNTILHDAIFNDIDLDYSCQEGMCEVCQCEVVGEIDELLESRDEGMILTCKARAKSDLILKYEN